MVTVLPTITRGLLEIVLKKSVENATEEFVQRTAVVYGGKKAGKLGGKKAPKTPSPHKAVRGITKSGVLAGK